MEVPSRVAKQTHGRKEASHLTFWAPSSSKFFRLQSTRVLKIHFRSQTGGWTSPDFQLPHLWLCELKRKNPNRFELLLGCFSEDVWYQKNPEWGWYQKNRLRMISTLIVEQCLPTNPNYTTSYYPLLKFLYNEGYWSPFSLKVFLFECRSFLPEVVLCCVPPNWI